MPVSRNASCPCGSGKKYKHCHGAADSEPGEASAVNPATAAQLSAAGDALNRGNLQRADLICRQLLEQVPGDPIANLLLGHVALRIGRPDLAVAHYEQTWSQSPRHPEAGAALARATAALEQMRGRTPGTAAQPHSAALAPAAQSRRFLVVKAWGCGFWSDVDHVAGQLLLAEMTGRIPVIHWGRNSLFSAPQTANAFELYFLPVSELTLDDVARDARTFFPSKWGRDNLLTENLDKWEGAGSRISGLYGLARDEDVIVSDFHTALFSLIPWIDRRSEYFGMTMEQIYRRIFATRLRLQPRLDEATDRFWNQTMADGQWLAVHVRGSDKALEVGGLADINASYYPRVDQFLEANPGLSIFLLTDSEYSLRDFKQRYGARLLHSDCTRTATTQGIHYAGHSGQRLAQEVILDTSLAARCEFFIGNGASNVSTTVGHLKNWAADRYVLLGPSLLSDLTRIMYLH